MKLNSRMHDWAAVNTWSGPGPSKGSTSSSSSYGTRHGRYSVNIPLTTVLQPKFKMRRCHTTLMNGPGSDIFPKGQVYRPRDDVLQRESSTLEFIRYLKVSNKESEARLKNKSNVLHVQRSKSDETRDTPTSVMGYGTSGLLRERTQFNTMHHQHDMLRREVSSPSKQEMKVGVAMVPRKGLISLSTLGEREQFPDISVSHAENRSKFPSSGLDHGSHKMKKTLINRKEIMDHYMAGFKRLEDEEQQKLQEEELQKSLGDYTIMDLQSKILQMTDAKALHRSSQAGTPRSESNTSMHNMKSTKPLLPAIQNMNPFVVK